MRTPRQPDPQSQPAAKPQRPRPGRAALKQVANFSAAEAAFGQQRRLTGDTEKAWKRFAKLEREMDPLLTKLWRHWRWALRACAYYKTDLHKRKRALLLLEGTVRRLGWALFRDAETSSLVDSWWMNSFQDPDAAALYRCVQQGLGVGGSGPRPSLTTQERAQRQLDRNREAQQTVRAQQYCDRWYAQYEQLAAHLSPWEHALRAAVIKDITDAATARRGAALRQGVVLFLAKVQSTQP